MPTAIGYTTTVELPNPAEVTVVVEDFEAVGDDQDRPVSSSSSSVAEEVASPTTAYQANKKRKMKKQRTLFDVKPGISGDPDAIQNRLEMQGQQYGLIQRRKHLLDLQVKDMELRVEVASLEKELAQKKN